MSNEIRRSCRIKQHVHEVVGSTRIAEPQEEPHNHRFATVSGEAIPRNGSHVHEVRFRTDTFEDHEHEFCGTTSLAIDVGNGRHVHSLRGMTTINDGHRHQFIVATLIENPIGD